MNISNKISTRIRYAETDQMGVVHHGNYAQFLEMGRIELLRELGISYKSMEEDGVMLPVVSMQVNYKKSAYFDDLIFIKTMIKETPGVKIIFDYEITNESDELLATASTVLAFLDKTKWRPMKCPNSILKKLEDSL